MNKNITSLTIASVLFTICSSVFASSGFSSLMERPGRFIEAQSAKESLNILILGDSNGALPHGWVYQLKKIRSSDSIMNLSISGNTIGFNNLGQNSLNTLFNIRAYMGKGYSNFAKIDAILIMLGTNDCKAVFTDSLLAVPKNMKKLITSIRDISSEHGQLNPQIYIVSPPPFGDDQVLGEKYKGGLQRVIWLNDKLRILAREENVIYINSFSVLLPVFEYLSTDGVHLNDEGQLIIASIIVENLKFLVK